MTHLKRCGPVRAARAAKRTAMIEIVSDEHAANDPLTDQQRADAAMFAGPLDSDLESRRMAGDRAEPTGQQKAERNDERALALQLRQQDVRDAIGGR